MATVTRLFEDQVGAEDARGNGSRIIKYAVSHARGEDPRFVPGIPRKFDRLEPGSRYKVDSLLAERVNDNEPSDAIVSVAYSTDGRFSWPDKKPKADDDDFLGVEWEDVDKTLEIPSFTPIDRPVRAEDPTFGTPYVARGIEWKPGKWTIEQSYRVLERTVVLPYETMTEARAALTLISAQDRKIHQFDGRAWRFRCVSGKQIAALKFKIVYRWISDPGTPAFDEVQNLVLPTIDRPPFYRYRVLPAPMPTPENPFPPPTIDVLRSYGNDAYTDPEGFRQLPGDPI